MVDALLWRWDSLIILIRRIQYIFKLFRTNQHMAFERNISQFLEIRFLKHRDEIRNAKALCFCPAVFHAVLVKFFDKTIGIKETRVYKRPV